MYSHLYRLAPMILEKQEAGGVTAALVEGEAQRSARLSTGGYIANIVRAGGSSGVRARIAAMFLQTGPNEFIVTGSGMLISPSRQTWVAHRWH
ncbi:DUF5597 domain-containing protein [Edaphobacter modestus]|uniref:DUF5597 domain-containing protein n=1 Tax=Edaphobacter modestus TaxID=388466 RepID=UPI003BF837B7